MHKALSVRQNNGNKQTNKQNKKNRWMRDRIYCLLQSKMFILFLLYTFYSFEFLFVAFVPRMRDIFMCLNRVCLWISDNNEGTHEHDITIDHQIQMVWPLVCLSVIIFRHRHTHILAGRNSFAQQDTPFTHSCKHILSWPTMRNEDQRNVYTENDISDTTKRTRKIRTTK